MSSQTYLGVVLQVGGFRPHHDGDDSSPGSLSPLDVAGGYVGGEVVTLRQHLVQAGGQTLGQNTYTSDSIILVSLNQVVTLPIIGLLFGSARERERKLRRREKAKIVAFMFVLNILKCSGFCTTENILFRKSVKYS